MSNCIKYDVIKKGCFAEVGDLVREGWSYEARAIAPPYIYGVVIWVHPRSLENYSAEHVARAPIHSMKILCTTGEVIRRYSVHVEVISEAG